MVHNRAFLINPHYPGYFVGAIPAGLGYIAEALEENGIDCQVLDMGFGYKVNHLKRRLKAFQPSLVGVSMMTFKHKSTYEMIHDIKSSFPGIRIVVGGPHVSTLRETVMQDCKSIDFGIVHEGESAIIELCRGIPLPNIKGLIHRDGDRLIYTGNRPFEQDLDSIPFPKYRQFELDRYSGAIPVVSSRGCPYSCIYCHVKNSMGTKIRVRSVSNVVDEIEYWYRRGKKRLGIADDNFTFYRERVVDICEEIKRRRLVGVDLVCGNGLRADRVDKELLQAMREAGFSYVSFGVEGGNDKVLRNLKKGESMETIQRAIAEACDLGYDVGLHFVVGAPEETWADIQDSLAMAAKFPIYDFWFNNLIPYPKTELYDWVVQNNYFTIQPSSYFNDVPYWMNEPVFETPELSVDERKRAIEEAERLRVKVRKNYFKRRLSKYSFLGNVAACLAASKATQERIFTHGWIRRAARRVFLAMADRGCRTREYGRAMRETEKK